MVNVCSASFIDCVQKKNTLQFIGSSTSWYCAVSEARAEHAVLLIVFRKLALQL